MVLTYAIHKIIHHSAVWTTKDPLPENLKARNQPDQEPYTCVRSFIDNNSYEDNNMLPDMLIIHPEELIKMILHLTQGDNQTTQLHIVEAINKRHSRVNNSPTNIKFKCNINGDAYEDILLYNQVLDYLTKDDEDNIAWK